MNNNKNNENKRIIPIILIIVAIVAMLPVIISLIFAFWPVFFLALFGLLVFAVLKIVFRKKKAEAIIPEEEPFQPISTQQPETEFNIIQKAFGLLQRRITERLELEFPGARWVWAFPNAMERFSRNEPLIVFLNSAGGYNKAKVVVHNLIFKGLQFITLETTPVSPVIPVEPAETGSTDDDDDDVDESESSAYTPPETAPVNYGRLAFEWVDANMLEINAKYNEAIAQNKSEMLIPAEELPHPDSWTEVCEELKRNGFSVADFCEDGIIVNITD